MLVVVECLRFKPPLGAVGLALEFAQVKPAQEPKPLVRKSSCVPGSARPSYSTWCWNRCCVLLTLDLKILGVLELLGVEPPLCAVGLAAKFVPKVNLKFFFILQKSHN